MWIPGLCVCVMCILTETARNRNSGHILWWEGGVWELGAKSCRVLDLLPMCCVTLSKSLDCSGLQSLYLQMEEVRMNSQNFLFPFFSFILFFF